MTALIVFAQEPVPGRAKMGLSPPCDPEQAAWVAAAALEDTLEAVKVARSPSRRLVAFAGDPRGWVPRRFEVVGQPDGDLLHRLTVAFSEVGGPALLIGTRTPQLTPQLLDSALAALLEADTEAVLGPTQSERVWAIGLRERDPRLLRSGTDGDPTDSGTVRARLSASGLRIAELARLRAVETFSDAVAVAEETPNRRFVEALGALPFGADPANA